MGKLRVPPPPPVTKQSPQRARAAKITFAVKDFLDAELALPDRHHGPKGRWAELSRKVNAVATVPMTVLKPAVEWALDGCAMGVITPWVAAQALAKSWT